MKGHIFVKRHNHNPLQWNVKRKTERAIRRQGKGNFIEMFLKENLINSLTILPYRRQWLKGNIGLLNKKQFARLSRCQSHFLWNWVWKRVFTRKLIPSTRPKISLLHPPRYNKIFSQFQMLLFLQAFILVKIFFNRGNGSYLEYQITLSGWMT